jgi:hypothetical protein
LRSIQAKSRRRKFRFIDDYLSDDAGTQAPCGLDEEIGGLRLRTQFFETEHVATLPVNDDRNPATLKPDLAVEFQPPAIFRGGEVQSEAVVRPDGNRTLSWQRST